MAPEIISDSEKIELMKLGFKAIGAIVTACCGVLIFLAKLGVSEFKKYRLERAAHDLAIAGKFESIDKYMSVTDKVQSLHEQSIKELKSTTSGLEKKVYGHGMKLTAHEAKLKFLLP